MKIRFTQQFLNLTGEAQTEYDVQVCGCGQCETGQYYCTTIPATYQRKPNNYGTSDFHHVHVSNVEPCDPESVPGPEPQEQAKPCVAEPAGDQPRPAPSETTEETK